MDHFNSYTLLHILLLHVFAKGNGQKKIDVRLLSRGSFALFVQGLPAMLSYIATLKTPRKDGTRRFRFPLLICRHTFMDIVSLKQAILRPLEIIVPQMTK